MAVQTGFVTLTGKIGNQIYYEKNGKKFARSASATTKQTAATKKSGTDFGRASSATALIRKTFLSITKNYSDPSFIDRTKRDVIKVINTGPAELKGQLQITDGDVGLLKTLEFNRYASLDKIIRFLPEAEIDKTDTLTIMMPQMETEAMFSSPEKADTALIRFVCGTFHFDLRKAGFVKPDDLKISLKKETFPGGRVTIPLQAAENSVIIVGMTAGFLNNDGTAIGDRRFYAGRFIEAVNIMDGKIVEFKYPEKSAPEIVTEPGNKIKWEMNEEE